MTVESNEKRLKIIDQVIKLLALAEGSSYTEEAKAAKDKAASLMAKNNLDIGEIVPEEDFDIDTHDTGRKLLDKIESTLMNSIASFNGVKLYTCGSTVWNKYRTKNATYQLVGRKIDIIAAKYMFDIVKNQMDMAMAAHRKQIGAKFTDLSLKQKNAFRRGFVYGVNAKINELIALRNAKVQEWGLVPVSTEKMAANWYESGHKTSIARGLRGSVSASGYDAGKNVSLHKGVERNNSSTLRIGY